MSGPSPELEAAAALHRAGRLDEALARYQALRGRHASDELDFRIAAVHAQKGELAAAAEAVGRALAVREAAPYRLLEADLREQAGDRAAAVASLRRALELDGAFAPAHARLAVLLQEGGAAQEALSHFAAAAQLRPGDARAWSNLAACLHAIGRNDEAEGAARTALKADPRFALAHLNLGRILAARGRMAEGRASLEQCVALQPANGEAWDHLGRLALETGPLVQARGCFERAVHAEPRRAGAWVRLASTQLHLGEPRDAADALGRAEALRPPDAAQIGSTRLIALQYDSARGRGELWAAHREWAARYAPTREPVAFGNARRPDRRLRIGYVSPRFHRSSASFLLEPVMAHHDPAAVEVHCYAQQDIEDDLTARLRGHAAAWTDTRPLSDEALARRMRADAIDIAVDLAGHTPGSRLAAFAWRPAPVCVAWLDYFDTTGVETMDYLLTDRWHTPEGDTQPLAETPLRLAAGRFCYRPPEDAPPVLAPPLARGAAAPVFGSFNRMAKVSEATLEAWSRTLEAVPGSRLLIKNSALNHAGDHAHFAARFAARGIDPARVEWRGFSPHAAALQEYSEIDIALDTFPYNGGLTTLEALWMGRPVVTLRGDSLLSRQTWALLAPLGLEELAAPDAAGFAGTAAALAADVPRLARTCAGLRGRMAASPLLDHAGFTRGLEAAYREMWSRWASRTGAA